MACDFTFELPLRTGGVFVQLKGTWRIDDVGKVERFFAIITDAAKAVSDPPQFSDEQVKLIRREYCGDQ